MKSYLEKRAFTGPIIQNPPDLELRLFVVIPCFNETSLLPVFQSLQACTLPQTGKVEILAVINASEMAPGHIIGQNQRCEAEVKEWISTHAQGNKSVQFHVCIFNALPAKHAGVGLARKIGMDEGLRRFKQIGTNGIIVNLDVDCTVSENYFLAIDAHFRENPVDGAGIHFEHPIENESEEIRHAIVQYELHLRYYINMQRLIGFPWAYQTIGSAMAVRSHIYEAQGGMNKRKAGEDFYFLQKIIELGRFSEMNNATVYASARKSDRVPFGTGKAVNDITQADGEYSLYNPKSFEILQVLFERIEDYYQAQEGDIEKLNLQLDDSLRAYLNIWGFNSKIIEINQFTSNAEAFKKRFFREFNAFQLMKYLHWMRDEHYPNVSVGEGITYLFGKLGLNKSENPDDDLITLRRYDRD